MAVTKYAGLNGLFRETFRLANGRSYYDKQTGYAKYRMNGNLKTPPLTGQSPMNDLQKQAERDRERKNVKFIHEGVYPKQLQYKNNINKTE